MRLTSAVLTLALASCSAPPGAHDVPAVSTGLNGRARGERFTKRVFELEIVTVANGSTMLTRDLGFSQGQPMLLGEWRSVLGWDVFSTSRQIGWIGRVGESGWVVFDEASAPSMPGR